MQNDGDNFFKAFGKAYASTTIEMFSEETARLLPVLRSIWGPKAKSAFMPSILERWLKAKPARTLGWIQQAIKGRWLGWYA